MLLLCLFFVDFFLEDFDILLLFDCEIIIIICFILYLPLGVIVEKDGWGVMGDTAVVGE